MFFLKKKKKKEGFYENSIYIGKFKCKVKNNENNDKNKQNLPAFSTPVPAFLIAENLLSLSV